MFHKHLTTTLCCVLLLAATIIPLGRVHAAPLLDEPSGEVYTIDQTAPHLGSITRANTNPTDAAFVDFTVIFSEDVTGVDTADFSLTITGVSGASISSVTGTGSTRTVNVNTGSGNGSIRLELIDNDSIVDVDSHPLGGIGDGNGSFNTGETYAVTKSLTVTSTSTYDGWLRESSENSGAGNWLNKSAGVFYIGDDNGRRQLRGMLSFSTASLPDTAVITSVLLKLKRSHLVGSDPVTVLQGFMTDIKTGFFGTAAALQNGDFQAAASKTLGPSKPALISGGYTINLTNGKTFINKLATNGGLTQIRLRFKLDDNNDALNNYIGLYSGDSGVANRPQLVITYYVP